MSCSKYQNPKTDPLFYENKNPETDYLIYKIINNQETPLTTRPPPPPTIPHTTQFSIIYAILNNADFFYNLSQHVVMGWFVYISLSQWCSFAESKYHTSEETGAYQLAKQL